MPSAGTRFHFTDLSGLVAPGSAANYDLTHFEDVSPMYVDGSGNNWGHRVCTAPAITTPGTGYVLGDLVSLGYGTSFEIVAISGSGAVAAIRIQSPGVGQFTDPSDISGAPTGGTGTGLALSAPFIQYGPSVAFTFQDFTLNSATLTGLIVVAGGSGYAVNDTLHLADFPSITITVSAIASGGVITAVTVPATVVNVPNDYTDMVSSALTGSGAGAQFCGLFTFPQRPAWLSELNRLRTAIESTLGQHLDPNDPSQAVSGPWPVGGPTAAQKQNTFYYASATANGVITLNANYEPEAFGPVTSQVIGNVIQLSALGGGSAIAQVEICGINEMTASIVVGGNAPVMIEGDFYFALQANQGCSIDVTADYGSYYTVGAPYSITNPTATISASLWISGVTWSSYFTGSTLSGYLVCCCHVNQMVNPGRYTVTVTSTCPTTNDQWVHPGSGAYGTLVIQPRAFLDMDSESIGLIGCGLNQCNSGTGAFGGGALNITNTWTGGTAYPGIHNSLPVWELTLGSTAGLCPAIYGAQQPILNAWNTGLYPPPVIAVETLKNGYSSGGLSTTPAGLWTAVTQAISNLNLAMASQMPWNQIRHSTHTPYSALVNPALLGEKYLGTADAQSNSYVQTTTVESQMEPPAWVASRYFSAGFTIMDSNGNFQTVTVAGVTGSTAPTWAGSVGSNTTDGAVTWRCVYKPAFSITPAQHRIPNIPRYPVYWQSETNAALMPPTSSSGLTIWGANNQWQRNAYGSNHDTGWQQDNLAYGWWIYIVSLNRMLQPHTGEVSVTIGCMRSGSFVAFGTYTTGQTVQVLWPVFTSDAVVYQCSERVDIQAVAIGGNVSAGAAVTKPICAAFVNDAISLLGLIT